MEGVGVRRARVRNEGRVPRVSGMRSLQHLARILLWHTPSITRHPGVLDDHGSHATCDTAISNCSSVKLPCLARSSICASVSQAASASRTSVVGAHVLLRYSLIYTPCERAGVARVSCARRGRICRCGIGWIRRRRGGCGLGCMLVCSCDVGVSVHAYIFFETLYRIFTRCLCSSCLYLFTVFRNNERWHIDAVMVIISIYMQNAAAYKFEMPRRDYQRRAPVVRRRCCAQR